MRLSNPARIVYATSILSLFFVGCGLWRGDGSSPAFNALPPKRTLPFSTREPEKFQAEIVVRTGDVERRTLIARNGDMRRLDFDPETDSHRALLISGKAEYVLDLARSTYTERELLPGEDSSSENLLHLLDIRDYTEFEEIGREGSTVHFRARMNEGTSSEVVIVFDESVRLPLKQEFWSIDAEQRTLRYSVELRNFRTEVDRSAFQIPAKMRRVEQPASR